MIVTFAWWFAFALACAALVLGVCVLCTFDKHKNVAACVAAVIAICLAVGVIGVTVGHATQVCARRPVNEQQNGFC